MPRAMFTVRVKGERARGEAECALQAEDEHCKHSVRR